jgi:hypothetical protein
VLHMGVLILYLQGRAHSEALNRSAVKVCCSGSPAGLTLQAIFRRWLLRQENEGQ